jgi:hypothetical protein
MGRWANAVGLAFLALVAVGAWFVFAPPPSGGAGWKLDAHASWEPVTGDLVPTVVPYATDGDDEVGLGITVYGSSSCPPVLRDVRIASDAVHVQVRQRLSFGGCTADAAPHLFGIVLERGKLPHVPFPVVVRADEREDRVPVATLP